MILKECINSAERWPSLAKGAALEMPCSREGTVGSNPTLSAMLSAES